MKCLGWLHIIAFILIFMKNVLYMAANNEDKLLLSFMLVGVLVTLIALYYFTSWLICGGKSDYMVCAFMMAIIKCVIEGVVRVWSLDDYLKQWKKTVEGMPADDDAQKAARETALAGLKYKEDYGLHYMVV